MSGFKFLLQDRHDRVALVQMNRPAAMNALSFELRTELQQALKALEADSTISAIVLTGGSEVFAAGADIKAIKDWTYEDASTSTALRAAWEQLAVCRKPVIAAVGGYALGAGCELALMCDFIIAADNAQFGQPEIRLGMIPGSGGTQRLTRIVGKSKAMEMVLTGRMMGAEEAAHLGLVSRVVSADELVPEAIKAATRVARMSPAIVQIAKQAVNAAYEFHLSEGLAQEASLFADTFKSPDRREGAYAFIEKRRPEFKDNG
ncbi:MAG: enoyl-CoA hydratase [Xanthomonadales bacterium]|nr:enoyl-CoA hydratase [Xanthomonadales bacterium]